MDVALVVWIFIFGVLFVSAKVAKRKLDEGCRG